MASQEHYVVELTIEYVDEEVEKDDGEAGYMSVYCDFQTEANHDAYEEDSYDHMDKYLEAVLPKGCALERSYGGPEVVRNVDFADCKKRGFPYVLIPILD